MTNSSTGQERKKSCAYWLGRFCVIFYAYLVGMHQISMSAWDSVCFLGTRILSSKERQVGLFLVLDESSFDIDPNLASTIGKVATSSVCLDSLDITRSATLLDLKMCHLQHCLLCAVVIVSCITSSIASLASILDKTVGCCLLLLPHADCCQHSPGRGAGTL